MALQKQDGWEYVVLCRDEDVRIAENPDSDMDEESDDDGKINGIDKADLIGGHVDARFETLEQANDRAMENAEEEHSSHMQYSETDPDDCVPAIGLFDFAHEGQESDLRFGDEGLTWDTDDAGCLILKTVEEGMEHWIEKRKKSAAT